MKTIRILKTPDGPIRFLQREVKSNGYKAVMCWQLDNNYSECGSVWYIDRNGKTIIHGTLNAPMSYKSMREAIRNLGRDYKMINDIAREYTNRDKLEEAKDNLEELIRILKDER